MGGVWTKGETKRCETLFETLCARAHLFEKKVNHSTTNSGGQGRCAGHGENINATGAKVREALHTFLYLKDCHSHIEHKQTPRGNIGLFSDFEIVDEGAAAPLDVQPVPFHPVRASLAAHCCLTDLRPAS